MAEKYGNSLSGDDVEIDGEVRRPEIRLADVNTYIKSEDSTKSKQRPCRAKEQFDSGYTSYSPQTSIEQTIPESITEKSPIQCSDASSNTKENGQIKDLETSLNKLTVTEEDEGISSYTGSGHSLENLNAYQNEQKNDEIEIDLYETDSDGDTLIHLAIVQKEVDITLVLIDIAEDSECLDIQNELFQTPLHLAVLTDKSEIAKSLVAKGADVTLRDKQGNTPLQIACRKGDSDMVKIMVESFGKNVTKRKQYFAMKNCAGLSCLHLAAQNKHYNIMGYLFAKGADVNIGDAKSGRTMLHQAVERKDMETLVLLLTHSDIDVDCKTYKGETPLVMAYWRNYQDMVKRLKAKGAYFSYDLFDESDDETTS